LRREWPLCASVLLLVACGGPKGLNTGPSLLITEVVSENTRGIEDDFQSHSDWIEITNYSARPVNLKNYGLSDNESEPYKWTFPYTVVSAGESIIVYASNRDQRDPANPLHTNFRISANGEPVLLTSPAHSLVDRAPPVKLLPNISWGRVGSESGRGQWRFFFQPTPLAPNDTQGRKRMDSFGANGLGINEVAVRPTDGFVDSDGESADWIELVNASGSPIDLDGYGLTDDLSDPFRWRFQQRTIDSGDHLAVFASAKNRNGKEPHTNFRIQTGEYIALFTPNGELVDLVNTEGGNDHVSLGRRENKWVQFGVATPGRANDVSPAQAVRSDLPARAITINEVMSESSGNVLGMDWVELKNGSDETVDLVGYGLSDDEKRPFRWRFPALSLSAGEMAVIGLTGQSCAPPDCRFIEADFRLSSFGETLTLSRPDGQLEDRLQTGRHLAGISSGRSIDGRKSYFDDPTPGKPNSGKPLHGYAGQPSLIVEELAEGQHQLRIPLTPTSGDVHYTIGGDPPSRRSRTYEKPILLKKGMVVRARAYKDGYLPSPIMTRTFLGDVSHQLPVVAITVDPYQMFNKVRGLHERGPGASDEYPYKGANFWSKRELLGHVEFLDEKGGLVLSSGTGVQIFGAWSRGIDKKSFKITARSELGSSVFEYPVFGEDTDVWMDQIVIRSGGQDALDAGFRDALATWLAEGSNVDLRRFAPAVLYINGQYWGIYNMRDPIGPKTLSIQHGVDPENIRIATGEGLYPSRQFANVRQYISTHSSKDPESMAWIETRVDLSSFMDWLLLEMFLDNRDGGNCRYWTADAPNSKWRWVFYDLDLGMNYPNSDTVVRTLSPGGREVPTDVMMLYSWLIRSPAFKERFLKRASHMYKEVFSPTRVEQGIAHFEKMYASEMEREQERWRHIRDWDNSVAVLRRFFALRPATMRRQFRTHFGLTAEETDQLFPVWK